MAELTDDERAMLTLETRRYKYAGAKETAIRDRFGISATVYYARLGALLERGEALAAEPVVVRRLSRLRDARRDARVGRSARSVPQASSQ